MSSPPTPRWQLWLCYLALAAAVAACSRYVVDNHDYAFHIATGREIVRTRSLPARDPFTFTTGDRHFVNPEWGAQVGMVAVQSTLGLRGLLVARTLLLVAGFALCLHAARRRGANPLVATALLLVALPSAATRFSLRPHVVAVPLIAFYLWVFITRDRRLLYALLPAQALWVNLHGSFVLGWALVAVALAGSWLDGRLARASGGVSGSADDDLAADGSAAGGSAAGDPATRWPPRRDLFLVALLHPVAALLNPWGHRPLLVAAEHAEGGTYQRLLLEWSPPTTLQTHSEAYGPFYLMAIAGLLSFLPEKNRRRAGLLLMLLLGYAMAQSSRRFVDVFFLLALAPLAVNATTLLACLPARAGRWLAAGAAAAGLVYLPVMVHALEIHHTRDVLDRPDAPRGSIAFLSRERLSGRLYASYNSTAHLMLALYPAFRLYVTPRSVHRPAFIARALGEVVKDPAVFEAEVARYDIDVALVETADGHNDTLVAYLDGEAHRAGGRWALCYVEFGHAVFLRRVPRLEPVIARHELVRVRAGFHTGYLADPDVADDPRTAAEIARLRADPHGAPFGNALHGALALHRARLPGHGLPAPAALGAEQRRHLEEAVRALSASVAAASHLPNFFYDLAWAQAALGRSAEALRSAAAAAHLAPEVPQTWALIAWIHHRDGNHARARVARAEAVRRAQKGPLPLGLPPEVR